MIVTVYNHTENVNLFYCKHINKIQLIFHRRTITHNTINSYIISQLNIFRVVMTVSKWEIKVDYKTKPS